MAACGFKDVQESEKFDQCAQCLKVERTTKIVRVPVIYNSYQQYNIKVPRQVNESKPRTVYYTDYETRQRQVPYTVNRRERRTRTETQKYQVPVRRCYTEMQTMEKQVAVPYNETVPETKMRTVTYHVPVQKTKTWTDTVIKTVYDTQVRRRCIPQEMMCSKEIPVYTVIAKPQVACPTGDVMDDFNLMEKDGDAELNHIETSFDDAVTNRNGLHSLAKSHTTRASGTNRNGQHSLAKSHTTRASGAGSSSRSSHANGNGKSIATNGNGKSIGTSRYGKSVATNGNGKSRATNGNGKSRATNGNGKSMATSISESISSHAYHDAVSRGYLDDTTAKVVW